MTSGAALRSFTAFVGVYTLFDVLPIVLPKTDVVRGVRWGDIVDAPLLFLLVAAYVALGLQAGLWRTNILRAANAFALVMLIQGHGIHMAANTISAYLDPASPGWPPAYFLDEHWGHAQIHLGLLLEALIFIAAVQPELSRSRPSLSQRLPTLLVACFYGLVLTADAIEGQTVPLMIPAGIALTSVGFFLSRREFSWHRFFFASALATTVVALAVYGVWNGGFPEHSWHVWQYVLEGPDNCC